MSDKGNHRLFRPETLTALGIIAVAGALLIPAYQLRPISALLPAAMLIGLIGLSAVLLVAACLLVPLTLEQPLTWRIGIQLAVIVTASGLWWRYRQRRPAAVLLLGMGVDSLSMNAGSLLRVKRVIRSFSCTEAREMLQAAIVCEEAAAVHLLMKQKLEDKGLGGLIRPGR
mgnify:CR=1 FL=1